MNDVMTAVHRQSLLKFMKRGTLELPLFIKYLRTPLIKRFERRYYQEASFIHLQTSSERDEAYRMLGRSYAVHFEKVHVAPNGIDASFIKLEYEGYDSNILLFMTSLEGSRAKEGQWFLKKIWPMVRERTDLTLYLVGSKPNGLTNLNDDRIVLKGFVEDLPQMCAQSAIGILPIFHKSGIINRLNDMLSVGMPVICTSAPASTLPDLINGKHVLIADNALDFADKIVQLYGNIELREKMSQDAKQFMKTRPTWNDFVNKLSNGLMNLSKAGDK
jgi:glycosyltransferase involved in cell wall biosynthesis